MSSRKISLLLLFTMLMLCGTAFGVELKGVIISKDNGEALGGVAISVKGTNITVITDMDGKFNIRDFPLGEQTLILKVIGYGIAYKKVDASKTDYLVLKLEPRLLKGQGVVVTLTRASRGETPVAFSNITRKQIDQRYWAQDTPMLLMETPNLYAYSDAGNGIGYSYLKMRGFDQKRIAVMLNGIPLNDAESSEVYWIDLPDFSESIEDIQIQRGVGNSLYGASAMGGSVNLISSEYSPFPKFKIVSGYGSYNTRKLTFSGNSGLIKDNFVFYGRFSKLHTDGYRENSWSDMWAYFFGMARYGEKSSLKINLYGGPEKSHLAYKGITKEQLSIDRRYNPLQWDGETDHFNQPHYEILHNIGLNDNLNLANTLYYFSGDGYYDQSRKGKYIEEYNLGEVWVGSPDEFPSGYYEDVDNNGNPIPDSTTGLYRLKKTDLIRRRTVDEYDWGWIPNIACKMGKAKLTVGGEMRLHRGRHYGEVRWAAEYPSDLSPEVRYYDYVGISNSFTAFSHLDYNLAENIIGMLDLQYRRQHYRLTDDKRFGVFFTRDYDFITPRLGVNFKLTPKVNVFANLSTAQRQPAFKDVYDPTDYWSNPGYKPDNFIGDEGHYKFIGKELKPEKLLDIELGGSYSGKMGDNDFNLDLNIYRMQITDEIIPYAGQLDEDGYPISGNAHKTLHQGVEISANLKTTHRFAFNGNLSINDDKFEDYVEYGFDWDNWQPIVLDRSGNRIGGFPDMLANYSISYRDYPFTLIVSGRYVGGQYLDNSENEDAKLDGYHIVNLSTDIALDNLVRLPLRFAFRVNNLFDKEYIASGYIEEDDNLPRYIVGAERNFYASLTLEM